MQIRTWLLDFCWRLHIQTFARHRHNTPVMHTLHFNHQLADTVSYKSYSESEKLWLQTHVPVHVCSLPLQAPRHETRFKPRHTLGVAYKVFTFKACEPSNYLNLSEPVKSAYSGIHCKKRTHLINLRLQIRSLLPSLPPCLLALVPECR